MRFLSTFIKNNTIWSGQRFFSTLPEGLRSDFKTFGARPDPLKVLELEEHHKKTADKMREKFPRVMEGSFLPGRIVYRLCTTPPGEMIKNGGFRTNDELFVAANSETGLNKGSICFSLLPEVAAVFYDQLPSNQKKYLYGCLLKGVYFAPGGKWRQVIVPGAFPLPSVWMAREVMGLTKARSLHLGPLSGHFDCQEKVIWGDKIHDFTKDHLQMPEIIDYGNEDQAMEFFIEDSEDSRKFQEQVDVFYKRNCLGWPISLNLT